MDDKFREYCAYIGILIIVALLVDPIFILSVIIVLVCLAVSGTFDADGRDIGAVADIGILGNDDMMKEIVMMFAAFDMVLLINGFLRNIIL